MSSSQSKKGRYKDYEFKKLCFILGFERRKITELLDSMDTAYSEWTEDKIGKDGRPKTYLDGTVKTRTFRNPASFLKQVQKRIKKNILDKVILPDCIHGGVKGRSNITNAKKHQGKKYLFETDLQEFYPNISAKRVYKVFIDLGYSTHVSHWLTILTTRKNELPQGSPASTGIANIAFLPTDFKLLDLTKQNDITYTRYIDDLTFSSQKNFEHLTNQFLNLVIADNFKISRRKTNYEGGQSVTGIEVFLNKIDAPQRIIEKSEIEISTNAEKKPYTKYLNSIRQTNKKSKKTKRELSSGRTPLGFGRVIKNNRTED